MKIITKTIILVFFFILVFSKNAFSSFNNIKRVTFSTAYTLEKKEFVVGIFSPLGYGITDSLTLFTHPLLHLLLTPNIWLRWQIIHGNVSFSLTSGYIETFLDPKRLNFPGSAQWGGIISFAFNRWISLSFYGGYLLNLSPLSHGSNAGGSLNLLVTKSNLVTLQTHTNYNWTEEFFERPIITLVYSYAWEMVRVSAGMAIGKFPLVIGSSSLDIKELYVYPIIDLWWQF